MKSIQDLLNDFSKAKEAMEKLHTTSLPKIIGNEAVKVVKDNFKLHGYDNGQGVTLWDERLPATNKAYDKRHGVKGSVYNSSNPLLMQTRNLFNGVKYLATNGVINIGVNLSIIPYAEYVNQTRKYMPAGEEPPNAKILKGIEKKYLSEREKIMGVFKK